MSRMFGERIDEFVLSVDIMSEETLHELLQLVARYLEQQLGVVYVAVMQEGVVDGRPGITTLWSSDDHRPAFSVDESGEYTSCSAFSFGENQPIWLVGADREPLGETSTVADMWSGRDALPTFRSSSDRTVRTSVIHPLRRHGQPIGVLEFASAEYVEPTPASLGEVTNLADTLARAYRMYDVTEAQRQNTDRALGLLEASLTSESWTRLALPQMFVAYPGGDHLTGTELDDHQRVIGTLRRVVESYADKVHAVFWEDIDESGNITAQVIEHITGSEFGVCYFSERRASQALYADNANVLFEAGMMQALANSPGGLLRAWIPVRERDADPLPFDVAAERILVVARHEDGSFDDETFSTALGARLDSLLADLSHRDHQLRTVSTSSTMPGSTARRSNGDASASIRAGRGAERRRVAPPTSAAARTSPRARRFDGSAL